VTRARLIGISILLLFAGSLCVLWHSNHEASYNSRRASACLYDIWPSGMTYGPGSRRPTRIENDQARNAIVAMGTNALPTIIWMLQCHDTDLHRKLIAALSKQKALKFHFRPPSDEVNLRGMQGVRILSTNAAAAVPALIPYLSHTNWTFRENAIGALRSTGPAATNALRRLIEVSRSDSRIANRADAFDLITHLGLSTNITLPVITNALADSDSSIRGMAVFSLNEMPVAPEILVPILRKQLDDSSVYVRAIVMWQLSKLKRASLPAVPNIERLLKSDDINTRLSAREALDRILEIKTPPTTAEPPVYEFNFQNTPVSIVLDEYKDLIGKPIRRTSPAPITLIQLFTVKKLTKSEAIAVLESTLKNQAHITFKPTDNGALEVQYGN
jgi:hypothetical protein